MIITNRTMKYVSVLVLILVGYQCNTTNSPDTTVTAFGTVIYGNITGINESNLNNIKVGLSTHRNGCSTPVDYTEMASVHKPGRYEDLFRSFFDDSEEICHQVSLLYVETQGESPDSTLISTKKIDTNWKVEPPYDSVRVDFEMNSKK